MNVIIIFVPLGIGLPVTIVLLVLLGPLLGPVLVVAFWVLLIGSLFSEACRGAFAIIFGSIFMGVAGLALFILALFGVVMLINHTFTGHFNAPWDHGGHPHNNTYEGEFGPQAEVVSGNDKYLATSADDSRHLILTANEVSPPVVFPKGSSDSPGSRNVITSAHIQPSHTANNVIYSNNVYDQLCSSKTYGATDYYNVAPYEMLEFSPSVVFSPGQDDQSVRVEFRIISAKNKVLWSSVLTSASPPELVQVPIAGQQIVGLETSALDPGSCAEVFAAFLGPRLSTP